MIHPVARSNRVNGQGRGGTNCGEKNQNNGTQKQQWPNFPRTGKNILKLAKLTDTLFPGIPLVLLLIITQANGKPHEPMAWKLYNLPESKLIQTQIRSREVEFLRASIFPDTYRTGLPCFYPRSSKASGPMQGILYMSNHFVVCFSRTAYYVDSGTYIRALYITLYFTFY